MIGKQIAHYEVVAKIGEGGMGAVYRARDTRLDREVALKVLPPEFARDPERVARFRREARLLASLNHAHIAALHGLEEADGEIYLAMELVEGNELAERMEHGPIELEEALEFARQLAEGLESAHEQNIVHRDLKPANLKVNPDGVLKILDFGLARAYLGDPEETGSMEHSPTITAALTGQGVILGTAAYMSPEQARGRKIDHRTDIWAFGVILFEMLTGERLFRGETISDTMAAVLRADPPWDSLPAGTPRGVRRLLERCLERDGRRRLRDIGEARVRLERWREDPGSLDESYGISEAVGTAPAARARLAPWIGCAVLAALAGVFGWMAFNPAESPPRRLHLELDVVDESDLPISGTAASISPNGIWIAWNTNEGIHVRDLRDATTRLLSGTAGATSQVFSPDSQWIAFHSRGRLRRVSVDGGAPIDVANLPTPRGFTWVDEITIVAAPNISSGLEQIDLRDGSVSTLTELDTANNERSHRWPTAVPGQRAVLFEAQFLGRDYDESDVRYIRLDAREQKTIYRGGAAPTATGEGHVLFARDNGLFAVEWDRAGNTLGGLAIPVLQNLSASVGNQENDDGSAQYWLDGLGTLLYLDRGSSGSELSQLAWYDLATGERTPISPAGKHIALRISPDGRRVAVERERDQNVNLYVRDIESGEEIMLTRRESVEYLGAFSPDSEVLYWSQGSDDGERFEIWRRPIDGSSPPEFVIQSPNQAGIWPSGTSPDGRYLLAEAWQGGDRRDLMLLDLEDIDAGFTTFAGGPGDQLQATWLDAEHVVYADGDAGATAVVIRRFPDTGAVWTLPEHEDGYYYLRPTENGSVIVAMNDDGIFRFEIGLGSGSVRISRPQLLRRWTDEELARISDLDMHPSGLKALVLQAEGDESVETPSTLVIITGWVQKLSEEFGRRP